MTFKVAAVITAIASFLLGLGYLFFGEIVIGRWHMEITDGVLVVGRRLGALNLGLSVIFFLARTAPVSAARTALSAGTATALWVLVLLGIYELAVGHVGAGIVASIAVEGFLGSSYLWILLADRRQVLGRSAV